MNRLRQIREAHHMTQKDLGDKLNLQSSVISKYERGAVSLTAELIQQICDIYDISADYLLCLSDSPSNKKSPLTVTQGDRIIQEALKDTGILAEDGSLSPSGETVVSDFLRRNAELLKQLVKDKL